MAKSRNQKAKILVLEHLLHGTGEHRVVTMQEILEKLSEYGIAAERKSIYDDIEALREFGLDVEYKRGRPGGYYLANDSMEIPEVGRGKTAGTEAKDGSDEKQESTEPVETQPQESTGWKINPEEIKDTEKMIKLQCKKAREPEIRKYLGNLGEYKEKESGYVQVSMPYTSGSEFYGWLVSMGKDVHILKPRKAAVAYRDYLKTLAKEYKGI